MIPVFEPEITEEDHLYVMDALKKGEISGSFGNYIPDFENSFATYCECKYGIAVSSGTSALQLAVASLELEFGDEILVSANTNIATALAAYHNNCIPIPVDAESETWNLNVDLIESLITPKTKAIIPVHIYGHPVQMGKLMEIANRHNLIVIEDCAEAHGAEINGRKVGSFGHMSCFSFYANKIITTGEGGMVVTKNQKLADKLKLLRNLAFTTPRFWHELPGFNYRLTGMQAALGLSQFKRIDEIIKQKRQIAKEYNKYLLEIPYIQTPIEKSWAKNVYWMYAIVIKEEMGFNRNDFMRFLLNNGIDTRTFFCSIGDQPFLKKQSGYRYIPTPVADKIWNCGLYLPSSLSLTEFQIAKICDIIKNYFIK